MSCLKASVGAEGGARLLDRLDAGVLREVGPLVSVVAEHLAELADLAGIRRRDQEVHAVTHYEMYRWQQAARAFVVLEGTGGRGARGKQRLLSDLAQAADARLRGRRVFVA